MAEHAKFFLSRGFREAGSFDIGCIKNQQERMLVDTLEDFAGFRNLGHGNNGEHDFRILGGKSAFCLDERRAPLDIGYDGVADGSIFLGDDQEHFLRVEAVNRAVGENAGDIHREERIQSHLDGKDGHSDDDEDGIRDEAGRSDVHAILLLDDCSHEVYPAGRSVGAEYEAAADAVEHAAEKSGQEQVLRRKMSCEDAARSFQDDGIDDKPEDGKPQELPRQLVAENPEERDVDDEKRDGNRDAERQVEDAGDADRPVCQKRERREHHVDADGRDDAAEEDHGILLDALVPAEDVCLEKESFF